MPSGRRRGRPARRSAAAARGPAGLSWRQPPGRPACPGWRQRRPARRRTTVMPPRPRPHPGRRPAPTSAVRAPGYAPSRGRERAGHARRQHPCRTPRRRRQRPPAPPRPHVLSRYAPCWAAHAVRGIAAAGARPIHPEGPATARQDAVRSAGTTRSAEHSGHHARNAGFLPITARSRPARPGTSQASPAARRRHGKPGWEPSPLRFPVRGQRISGHAALAGPPGRRHDRPRRLNDEYRDGGLALA